MTVAAQATIQRIRQRRVLMAHLGRLKPVRKRLPIQAQPDNVRLAYFRALRALIRDARDMLLTELRPELPRILEAARAIRGDSSDTRLDAGPSSRLQALIEGVAHAWQEKHPTDELTELANRYAEATSKHQKTQLSKQLKAGVGVDVLASDPNLKPRLEAFAVENVSLIRSMSSTYFSQVETMAMAALRDGDRAEALADDLVDRFDVADSRAKLIARDQIGKLNGELNQVRQEELGVTGYIWRTMEDNRVRPEHQLLDGKFFEWDDAPEDGHPGFPINCRCYAEPDLSELLSGVGGLPDEGPDENG